MSRKAARKGSSPAVPPLWASYDDARMRRYPDGDWQAVQTGPDGSFCWSWSHIGDQRIRLMYHKLPGGSVGLLYITQGQKIPTLEGHQWTWDGNLDAPTLKPSVKLGRYWHGHFTAGVMRCCEKHPRG